jgi:quercetin dioxygenase-like cupin family protein
MHMTRSLAMVAALATMAAGASFAEAPLAIDPAGREVAWGPCPPIFGAGCELAVLHGAPDKPNADALLRIAGGKTLAAHRHTSAERMILLTGRLRVRYQGQPARVLQAGHYAYGPAGLPHEATCLGRQRCTLFIAFEGPVDAELTQGALR